MKIIFYLSVRDQDTIISYLLYYSREQNDNKRLSEMIKDYLPV